MVSEQLMMSPRVSQLQRAVLLLLLGAFLATGIARLNTRDLFNPDSPRYVLYARALATGQGYRMIDVPGERLYTWRPPGLSLLLAPAAWLRPFDTIAAKSVVLAMALLLLLTVFLYARKTSNATAALLVTGLVASSPVTLVLGTEVLTEVPYTFLTLLILYLIGGAYQATSTSGGTADVDTTASRKMNMLASLASVVLVVTALAFLPLIRTIGVALIAAVGLWALTARRRWRWLPAAAIATGGLLLWSWRNKQVGGPDYTHTALAELSAMGLTPALHKILSTAGFYRKGLFDLLLPGFGPERLFYSPLMTEGHAGWNVLARVASIIAPCLVLLALLGMWRRRKFEGGAAFLYVVLYIGCLTVWPWRHERFAWPLVPLVWVYVPCGAILMWELLQKLMVRLAQPVRAAAFGSLCALLAWQVIGCLPLVEASLKSQRDDSFYADDAPSLYFCDWQGAGEWLHDHTPADTRLLTRHAAVALTAHRYQQVVLFETVSPEKLRQQIKDFAARYLVVPTSQFGDGFPTKMYSDLEYRLTPVYHARDVVVLEIEPNRSGTVPEKIPGAAENLAACQRALIRSPHRTDLQIRLATLLNENGQTDEALKILLRVANRGVKTVRLFNDLGWTLMAKGKYPEAARYLSEAAMLPDAESVAASLRAGAAEAQRRAREQTVKTAEVPLPQLLLQARSRMGQNDYIGSLAAIDVACAKFPASGEAHYVRGILLDLFGRDKDAEAELEKALELRYEEAGSRLALIRSARALQQDHPVTFRIGYLTYKIDPRFAAEHVEIAARYQKIGRPAQALGILEKARERFRNSRPVLQALAKAYRSCGYPERSAELEAHLLSQSPRQPGATHEMAKAQDLIKTP